MLCRNSLRQIGLRSVGLNTRLTTSRCIVPNLQTQLRLLSSSRSVLNSVHRSDEYIPSSRVVIDKDGKKVLKKPMTTNHSLPDPLAAQKRERVAFILFCIVMSVSLFGIFNYEKVSSPVMNATMYFLRRSNMAREAIGKEITFSGFFPHVRGELNTMKGNVDLSVYVGGDKNTAKMILKANRDSRMHNFDITEWKLVVQGTNEVIDLLKDNSISLEL